MNGYIFIFSLVIVSEFFVQKMNINIPGSILALILLFTYFYISKKVPASIEDSSSTLLKYLPLMLVPIGVGMKELFVVFDDKLIAMIIASILALILAVFITVFTIWIIKYFISKRKVNND